MFCSHSSSAAALPSADSRSECLVRLATTEKVVGSILNLMRDRNILLQYRVSLSHRVVTDLSFADILLESSGWYALMPCEYVSNMGGLYYLR